MSNIGIDLGYGNGKAWGPTGGLVIANQIAAATATIVADMAGTTRRRQTRPALVEWEGGRYFVGAYASQFGQPVATMDYGRLLGGPDATALLYALLSGYDLTQPQRLAVGLPVEMLAEHLARENASEIRRWLLGSHEWCIDGVPYSAQIESVQITGQAVGALYDYLLNEDGEYISERKSYAHSTVGVVSIGFNTIELLEIDNGRVNHARTSGATGGVRRLLELANPDSDYTLPELDQQLRANRLDISTALPAWQRQVSGLVEARWGKARRYARVLIVGGGADYADLTQFNGRGHRPDEPVLSIARGLYKLSLRGR